METEDQQPAPTEVAIRDEFLCFAEESLHSAMEELHYKGKHQTMTGGMLIVYVTRWTEAALGDVRPGGYHPYCIIHRSRHTQS